ncbi:hypothetical protein V1477_018139 [Vespula maculifrons]|uniref:Transmembrane protein n=1 Tax=Vespula maculifrons TaxID=7453 RepID=A0ABD2AYL9_VESMC
MRHGGKAEADGGGGGGGGCGGALSKGDLKSLVSSAVLAVSSHPSVIVIIVLTIIVTRGYSRIVDRTKSRNRVHAKAGRGERGDVEEEETEDEEQKKRNRSLSRKDGY